MKTYERFYRKWIKGECKHLCILCKYRKYNPTRITQICDLFLK